jgi:DNA polymerase-4
VKTRRSILHVDLHPFLVSVERSRDPALRERPLIVASGAGDSIVVAASDDARAAGVKPGLRVDRALACCPGAVVKPGDLETYARVGDEVTQVLLQASRRVERPSSDEAYLDLTWDGAGGPHPVAAAEAIKDDIQKRLGLDASLGLASSRLAARVASEWARPRGLLVVLPGYEASFLARQPISCLPDLPPHLAARLESAGLATIGQVAETPEEELARLLGATAARRLRETARAEGEEPIAPSSTPVRIEETALVRGPRPDRETLERLLEAAAERAVRRLRPFHLAAGRLRVEVARGEERSHRQEPLEPPCDEPEAAATRARELAASLLEPAAAVRSVTVRLDRLRPEAAGSSAQRRLFG